MATVSKWNPFGVALNVTATSSTVTRTSATKFTVKINVSWECYWDSNKTNYGMTASSGGSSVTINPFGTKAHSGSGTLTGTYSISGNGSATKTITVTFRNFNNDNGDSATKNVSFSVTVPALPSYSVSYYANGGTGAPSIQTKWKDQTLKLSTTTPTRTGYTFQGWATSASGAVAYAAGANYTSNASVTLYAVWKAHTYTVSYNANGGTGAPASQTKTYGTTLTLSSTKPTRTNYNFKGWGTSAGAATVSYASGASYTANAAITLYAIWELAYTKPRISSFSLARCDSSGTLSDSGTCVLVKFNWACDKTISSITVKWKLASSTSYTNSSTVSATGTSGTVNTVVGNDGISIENTYNFQIVVADSIDNTDVLGTIQGTKFPIDARKEGDGIAFGKPAETAGLCECAYDFQANKKLTVGKYIDNATPFDGGIKVHDLREVDAKPGMFGGNVMNLYFNTPSSPGGWRSILSMTGWSADSYATHELSFNANNSVAQPDIWHRTGMNGTWQSWRKLLDSYNYTNYAIATNGGRVSGPLTFYNDVKIQGNDTNGNAIEVMKPMTASNNIAIGYGLYTAKKGNLHLYGHDVVHYISNIATPGNYRPYRRKGDILDVTIKTAGFVTNGSKDVSFFVPFSEPIVGNPTVTVASGDGFMLRQGNAYTHGSSATAYVKPSTYSVSRFMFHGVTIVASFTNITNVTNNDSIGVYWDGTITLS